MQKIKLAGIFRFCQETACQAVEYPGQTDIIGPNGFLARIRRDSGQYSLEYCPHTPGFPHTAKPVSPREILPLLKVQYKKHRQSVKKC